MPAVQLSVKLLIRVPSVSSTSVGVIPYRFGVPGRQDVAQIHRSGLESRSGSSRMEVRSRGRHGPGRVLEDIQRLSLQLSARVGDVFMLREMEEMGTAQICEALRISQNNLWVMLHRARMALRERLELNWFENTGARGRLLCRHFTIHIKRANKTGASRDAP